jgi:hypothetical protein
MPPPAPLSKQESPPIAYALGMERQPVQRHLGTLKAAGILAFESVSGELTRFSFSAPLFDGLRKAGLPER